MDCKIRKWLLSDASELAMALSNKKVQDNLREGLLRKNAVKNGEMLDMKMYARIKE